MRGRVRYNSRLDAVFTRYPAAIALAVAAQVARMPLHPPTIIPFITYVPFVVVSALLGGFGPGLVTTILCALEVMYFAIEPVGSFEVKDMTNWHGMGAFLLTGITAAVLTERLQRSRQRLATVLESISDGFNTFDRQWRYTYVNPAAARVLGKTREELLGKNLWELWPHALDSPFGVAYRRAVTDNVPVHVEAFYAEPLNAWFEVRCYPSPDGLSLFFTDTTARKRAEQTSRLLSSIVQCSDDAIISKNLEGVVLSWNQGAERIYGYTEADAIGRPISFLMPPDHDNEYPQLLEHLKAGKVIDHYETERIRKDGRRILVSLALSPLREDGRLVGAAVIARDITEQKQAAKALALSEQRYRSLAFVTSQIVWTTKANGEVDDMPMWRAFTGQTIDQVQGGGWIDALHPDDRERTADIWSRAVQNHSFYDTEYRIRRSDGEYRDMSVHGVPVLESDGVIREWVGTCADITERKQAEQEITPAESGPGTARDRTNRAIGGRQ